MYSSMPNCTKRLISRFVVASFIIMSLGLVVCISSRFWVMLSLLHSELFAKLEYVGLLDVVELAESLYGGVIL